MGVSPLKPKQPAHLKNNNPSPPKLLRNLEMTFLAPPETMSLFSTKKFLLPRCILCYIKGPDGIARKFDVPMGALLLWDQWTFW